MWPQEALRAAAALTYVVDKFSIHCHNIEFLDVNNFEPSFIGTVLDVVIVTFLKK